MCGVTETERGRLNRRERKKRRWEKLREKERES